MSVSDGPRRHGAAHPIRNTAILGGVATAGAAVAGAAAVGVLGVAAIGATAVVGVAGYVGIRAAVLKTRSSIQNAKVRRQERRVANGGRRHGIGGKLLDAAAGNPGMLALGTTAATIGLLTSTPLLLVGGAAVGVGFMVRNLLRNRAQARGIQPQPSTLRQELQRLEEFRARQRGESAPRAEERPAPRRREEARPETVPAPVVAPTPERRAPATVAAAAEPPAAPAVPVSSEPSSQRRTVVRQRRINARTDGRRPHTRRVTGRPANRDAAVPAATLSTGNPTQVQAIGDVDHSFMQRRAAKLTPQEVAQMPAAPEITTAPAPVRARQPLPKVGPQHGRPAGVPAGAVPRRKSEVARTA